MYKLPRKPVAQTAVKSPLQSHDLLDDLIDDYLEPSPESTKTASAVDIIRQPQIVSKPSEQDWPSHVLRERESTPTLVSSPSELSAISSPSEPNAVVSSSSRWKAVVDETVYFAGGLISRPFESTKHYSVLRHSSAIVYYKGPSTNVTISVFADSTLPSDRSFWIQRKGFSGNMGMAASALMRTTSNWIDVTPSVEVLASSIPEGDERAWQRDIKRFLKKASKDKRLSKHVLRETCVLRIPAAAADGYLRIVMCSGQSSKKSLCPSPTFRLASTSSDVSVLRGAGLATLPVEVGLKVASVVGNQYVQRVVGPAQAIVQSKMQSLQPSFIKNHPDMFALAQSSVQDQYDNLEEKFDAARDVTYSPFHEDDTLDELPNIIGRDSGPETPFPITFNGKVVPGTGQSRTQIGIPTANLCNVADDLLLRLNGIYIGWAAIEQGKRDGILNGWREAIITIGSSPYAAPTVAPRKIATVHIAHDFGDNKTFFNAKMDVIVMAFLRPVPQLTPSLLPTDIMAAVSRDKEIAIASLSRERWQPDVCLEMLSAKKAQRSMTDRYIGLRSQVQKRVDSFPIHLAGIRTESAEAKDEAYGQGGFYIRR
ncbi:hypothetical protein FHL15_010391 [Xylaria flabelliformis]|uniref:Riboflavin kinase n=1 Tax=Xylaria flabelliformis TaxID=2512241 RepID=A0A553HL87_9PEZI|nr:hypothetical protein FHL15_010391 [Xylaria flabelliformis]